MAHFMADLHFLLFSGMGFLLLRIHVIHGLQTSLLNCNMSTEAVVAVTTLVT